jgi:hypothetical protein
MSKPIVFLSHSSRDKDSLGKLKDLLVRYTGSSVEFFLSSDGQSIPLGRNWVHEIQQALDSSKLMFAFVSPNSLHSSWLFFEAGYTYSKGIRVVPVGINGVSLEEVPPPISLLQGFNIKSEGSLNNIIAILNGEFGHRHVEGFTLSDYEALFGSANKNAQGVFVSRYGSLIDSISVRLEQSSASALNSVEHNLTRSGLEFSRTPQTITAFGLQVELERETPSRYVLRFEIGGSTPLPVIPVLSQSIEEVLGNSKEEFEVIVILTASLALRAGHPNLTAQLYGTDVRLGPGASLLFRNYTFSLQYAYGGPRTERTKSPMIRISSSPERLSTLDLDALLELLLERQILTPR